MRWFAKKLAPYKAVGKKTWLSIYLIRRMIFESDFMARMIKLFVRENAFQLIGDLSKRGSSYDDSRWSSSHKTSINHFGL